MLQGAHLQCGEQRWPLYVQHWHRESLEGMAASPAQGRRDGPRAVSLTKSKCGLADDAGAGR